jgi:tetratricopeptide (TPR) repeat protein
MNKGKKNQKLRVLFLILICGITVSYSSANSLVPPFSESETLEYVQTLKASKDEIMPGDDIPRRLRLARALHSLAKFYKSNKSYEKTDQYYGETFAILSEAKSPAGVRSYRYFTELAARDYLERGDLVKAKAHIDIALKICREDPKEKEGLPSVLTSLARWQKQMKLLNEAETTYLEAISLLVDDGFGQRRELSQIYLETGQLGKANKTIDEMEKSRYADYTSMFLRARWLRAMGKTSEADELDTKARTEEVEDLELRIPVQ